MRKIYLLSIVLAIFILCFYISCTKKSPFDSKEKEEIAANFIGLIQNNDFSSASKLFHYPSDYSSDQLLEDRVGVSNFLEFFNEEFGAILRSKLTKSPHEFYHVSIFGGDVPYWQKYPKYTSLTYKVEFEKEGEGYLCIHFCDIDNKWEIRMVMYGLPKSLSNSEAKILEIGSKMMKMLQNLMQDKK